MSEAWGRKLTATETPATQQATRHPAAPHPVLRNEMGHPNWGTRAQLVPIDDFRHPKWDADVPHAELKLRDGAPAKQVRHRRSAQQTCT